MMNKVSENKKHLMPGDEAYFITDGWITKRRIDAIYLEDGEVYCEHHYDGDLEASIKVKLDHVFTNHIDAAKALMKETEELIQSLKRQMGALDNIINERLK
jgi:hypothetical protein